MKKILTYFSMLALAVGCETFYGPVPESTEKVLSEGIEIAISETADNSFKATFKPKGETLFYSYLIIDAANAPETIDASRLYAVKYEGLKQGTFEWSAEKPSESVTVEKLVPNTTYIVYAVAGSTTGIPGEVVSQTVTTSDSELPTFAEEIEGTEVTITFNETVKRGTGVIAAGVYAYNSPKFFDKEEFLAEGISIAKPEETYAIAEEDITVNGNTVLIKVNGLPAGAYYTVALAEGAFVDAKGNKNEAVASLIALNPQTEEVKGLNLYGREATKEFDLAAIEDEAFSDPDYVFTTAVGSEYGFGWMSSKAKYTMTYSLGSKTSTFALTNEVSYNAEGQQIEISLPEEPVPGATVSVTIPAGAVEDWYGNTNKEWTAELLYSFGYTLEDILGTYSANANSAFQYPATEDALLTIAVSDNEKKGNVMFTAFLGTTVTTPIYATFDMIAGTLTVPSMQHFTTVEKYKVYYSETEFIEVTADKNFAAATSAGKLDKETPISFLVPKAGTITGQSGYFGVAALFDFGGALNYAWDDVYYGFIAERGTTETQATALTSIPQCARTFAGKLVK